MAWEDRYLNLISRAAPLLMCMWAFSALNAGCSSSRTEESPEPSISFHPSAMPADASWILEISVEGLDLGTCSSASVKFSDSHVNVGALEKVSSNTGRLRVETAAAAPAGDREATLLCDNLDAATGTLTVVPAEQRAYLMTDPPSGTAGQRMLKIDITGVNTSFDEDSTLFRFSSDSLNIVQKDVTDSTHAQLTVDIDLSANEETVSLLAVTGNETARGSWELKAGGAPFLEVDPGKIQRGTNEETINIRGNRISFDEESVSISFPENPWIEITDWEMVDSQNLRMVVDVRSESNLGTTRLEVRSGENRAETFLAVVPGEGTPVLRLIPERIERQIPDHFISLIGTNTHFDTSSPSQTRALPNDPQGMLKRVGALEVFSETSAILHLGVDPEIEPDWYLITVVTPVIDEITGEEYDEIAVANIKVVDTRDPAIVNVRPDSVLQGRKDQTLIIEGWNTEFTTDDPLIGFIPGPGISVKQFEVKNDTRIDAVVDIHPNSPVGTAYLTVDTGENRLRYPVAIQPVSGSPRMSFSPSVLAAGQNTTPCDLTLYNTLFMDAGVVSFDSPFISPSSPVIQNPARATFTSDVNVFPESGPITLEVETGQDRIASFIYVLSCNQPRARVEGENVFERGEEEDYDITLTIRGEGTNFDPDTTLASVLEESALQVIDLDVISSTESRLTLRVLARNVQGLTGVLLRTGAELVPVPLEFRVQEIAPFLNLVISPATVRAGRDSVDIEVRSQVIEFDEGWTIPAFSHPGINATEVTWISSEEIRLTLDVAANMDPAGEDVYVYIITGQGVAAGTLEIVPLDQEEISLGDPVETVMPEERKILSLDYDSSGWFEINARADVDAGLDYSLLYSDGFSVLGSTRSPESLAFAAQTSTGHYVMVENDTDAGVELTAGVVRAAPDAMDETEPNDDAPYAPGTIPVIMSAGISAPDDVDMFSFTAAEPVAVEVVSRFPRAFAWYTASVSFDVLDEEESVIASSRGWPSPLKGDPLVFIDPGGEPQTYMVRISSQVGAMGEYLLNMRSAVVISGVCGTGPSEGFIEISGPPGMGLGAYTVEVIDTDMGGPKDIIYLSGQFMGVDGKFRIASNTQIPDHDMVDVSAAVFPAPVAVRIVKNLQTVDVLEIGGTGLWAEGDPAALPEAPCLFRFSRIDSDDNSKDFIERWVYED